MNTTAMTIISLSLLASSAQADLLSQVKAGKIITISLPGGSGPKTGRAMALIRAPSDVVAQILSRIDVYKEFVPRCTGSRRVKKDRFVVESNLPWPVNRTWVYVVLQRRQKDRSHFLRWKMTNGTLKRYEGMAWIQPLGKDRSVLTYQMLAVPKTVAPDALISYGLREAVTEMVEAVRERAAVVLARRPPPGVNVASQK